MHAPENTKSSFKIPRLLRDIVQFSALVVVLMGARSSLADHYVIPSGSMEPTLGIDDRVVVDKRAFGLRLPFTQHVLVGERMPERGDVVVFDSPEDGTRLIKRVIALPGDTIEVNDGRVRVNGRTLRHVDLPDANLEQIGDSLHPLDLSDGPGPDQRRITLPPGQLFVMGDHRGNSADSRFWGLLPARNLLGVARGVFWSGPDGRFTWRPLAAPVDGVGER